MKHQLGKATVVIPNIDVEAGPALIDTYLLNKCQVGV